MKESVETKMPDFTAAEKSAIEAEIKQKFTKTFAKIDKSDVEELQSAFWYSIVEPGWTPKILSKAWTKYVTSDADPDAENVIIELQDELQRKVCKELNLPEDILE